MIGWLLVQKLFALQRWTSSVVVCLMLSALMQYCGYLFFYRSGVAWTWWPLARLGVESASVKTGWAIMWMHRSGPNWSKLEKAPHRDQNFQIIQLNNWLIKIVSLQYQFISWASGLAVEFFILKKCLWQYCSCDISEMCQVE